MADQNTPPKVEVGNWSDRGKQLRKKVETGIKDYFKQKPSQPNNDNNQGGQNSEKNQV